MLAVCCCGCALVGLELVAGVESRWSLLALKSVIGDYLWEFQKQVDEWAS